MADISKIKTPDGTTYDIKDSTARANSGVTGVKGNAESAYRKGNVNLTAANVQAIAINENGNTQQLLRPNGLRGSGDVTLQGLFNVTRANRLAYLPADQVIIEKTTDGGETWVDAGFTDVQKKDLFAETRNSYLSLPQIGGKKNLLCGLRITITAMKYNVPSGTAETDKYNYWNSNYISATERYCQLKEFYFWVSTSNDTMRVKVERASGSNSTSWQTCFEDNTYYMNGWSGSDYIRLNWQSTFGGGTTQTGNHWNYRFTFMTRGVNGTDTMGTGYETQSQSIADIRGYGDSVWSVANSYMAYDRIYSQDVDKNVTFPAKVTATEFVGNIAASKVTGTLGVDHGGTGKTNAKDAANQFMNALDTGSSTPVDADYYISQYVGGGTTTTTYHRRPMSALWAYIKGKFSGTSPITFNNGTIGINTASTSAYGATKLSTATNSTATDLAATPSAVKTAYDLANTANGTANTALSGVNGTLIYDHTYSITNGVATFVPHVYLKGEEVTSQYAASCFSWKYRLDSNVTGTPSYVNLTTDSTTKGCTVTISTLGYGGHVIGTFTPPSA